MFFNTFAFTVCIVGLIFSLSSFCFMKTKNEATRVLLLIFTIAFFALANIIIIPILQDKIDPKETEEINVTKEPDSKGTALLSLYVNDGKDISESYYVETTDHDTVKFCYFHEDGEHIVKQEVATSDIEYVFSDSSLPHRVEVYLTDGKPTLWQLYLPENSDAIQFDSGND